MKKGQIELAFFFVKLKRGRLILLGVVNQLRITQEQISPSTFILMISYTVGPKRGNTRSSSIMYAQHVPQFLTAIVTQ